MKFYKIIVIYILYFDGVLGDTERLQHQKWNIVLVPFGIEISEEEYRLKYCGKSSKDEIPQLLLSRYPEIPLTKKELAGKTSQVLKELFKSGVELMPGAIETLKFFRSKGLKIAVCSGSDQEELEMKLRAAGIAEWFPIKYRSTEKEVGGLGKPYPHMHQLARDRLKLKPYECLAFEDTAAGVKSAGGAGLFVVAMPNKWSEGQDFCLANIIIRGGWPTYLRMLQV